MGKERSNDLKLYDSRILESLLKTHYLLKKAMTLLSRKILGRIISL
jgi:hypothetical protein